MDINPRPAFLVRSVHTDTGHRIESSFHTIEDAHDFAARIIATESGFDIARIYDADADVITSLIRF